MAGYIFDIGNVIQPVTWQEAARVLNVSPEQYEAALRKDRRTHFDRYERSEIPKERFATFVLQNLGLEVTDDNLKLFSDSLMQLWGVPDSRLITIIQSLPTAAKKAILSDCCPELEARARSFEGTELDYLHLFAQNVFLSHKINAKKPERRAYAKVSKALGLEPKECYVIDDKTENITAAIGYGYKGILYENPKQLEAILSAHK